MNEAKYNQAADFYSDFVEKELSSSTSVLTVVTEQTVIALDDVSGLHVCDLACGQGHLSRRLAKLGARVTAIDVSTSLIKRAKQLTPNALKITYFLDDAQSLDKIDNGSFDVVVINMALMDIPGHRNVFENCHRILNSGGAFVFSILHPCFESPFNLENPPVESSPSGDFLACRISQYLEEGHWISGGDGVRGKVGAYHRTLSTYLNDLICSGFKIQKVYEPHLQPDTYTTIEAQWLSNIPRGLIIKSCKV